MLKTHKFSRKAFYVDAVRVSEVNIKEVAEWCNGTIVPDDQGHDYIQVEVYRPMGERQTQAYIGDWVLFAGSGYKVYTPKAFDKSFEKVRTLTKAQADEAGIVPPHEPRPANEKKQGPKPTPPRRPRPPHLTAPVISREMAQQLKNVERDEPVEEVREIQAVDPDSFSIDSNGLGQITDVKFSSGESSIPAPPPATEDIDIRGKTKQDLEAERLIAEVARLREE